VVVAESFERVLSPIQAAIYFLGFVGAAAWSGKSQTLDYRRHHIVRQFPLRLVLSLKTSSDRALRTRAIGWLMIGSYSVLTAAMTTIGRVGMGAGQSQRSEIYRIFGVRRHRTHLSREHHRERYAAARQHLTRKFHRLNWAVVIVLVLYQPFMFALSF